MAQMDIMALVDDLEKILDAGRSVPLAHGRLVDTEKVYEIIDEIRGSLPDELKEARRIVKERQEMLQEAESQANRMLEQARDRVENVAGEQEVVRSAKDQASAIWRPPAKTRASPPGR